MVHQHWIAISRFGNHNWAAHIPKKWQLYQLRPNQQILKKKNKSLDKDNSTGKKKKKLQQSSLPVRRCCSSKCCQNSRARNTSPLRGTGRQGPSPTSSPQLPLPSTFPPIETLNVTQTVECPLPPPIDAAPLLESEQTKEIARGNGRGIANFSWS